jgi:hypothetical protein
MSGMNPLNAAPQFATVTNSLSALLAQVRATLITPAPFRPAPSPIVGYEILRLAVVLDICDARGQRAVLARRQSVRFLVPDTRVVRDLIGGNGNQVALYTTHGLSRLAPRPEGPKQVMLLGAPHRPAKGERVRFTFRVP